VLADLEKLVEFFGTPFETAPSFERLWELADPPLLSISAEDNDGVSRDLVGPALDYAWRDVAAAKDATGLNDEYKRRFQEAREHYARLVNHIAAWALWRISGELDELIKAYQDYKRRAAMLDFTDLLCFARDLVRDNATVRAVIADRYQHILVDEFQDTDPVQAELLFRIAADGTEESDAHWSERRSRPGALFMVGDPKQAIYGFRGGDVVSYRRVRRAIEASWPGNVLQLTNNFRSRPAIIEHVNTCFSTGLCQVRSNAFSRRAWPPCSSKT
jgi:CRISPR-associated exonuclease Cas4